MITFKDNNDQENVRVDPGKYEAEIYKVDPRENGISISFRSIETKRYLCSDFFPLSEKSRSIVIKKLSILGMKKNDDGNFGVEDDGANLIGRSAVLTLSVADDPKYVNPDFKSPNYGYKAIEIPF